MTPPIISSLADIAERYDALFCDLWGCLHNGVRAYPAAVAALQAFRAGGGAVMLLTNAPRPRTSVQAQLDRMGAPHDAYDGIVSSGDAARASVERGEWGARVYHIGAEKDEPFFEGLEVERVRMEDAETLICTGLRDDRSETPEDYADELREAQLRRLPMLCANPDVTVHVGDKLLYCAGALAEAYEKIGGETRSFGKPHAPIYDMARRRLVELTGRDAPDGRILAIGDGIRTDIAGGVSEGIDTLFVTGGLAVDHMGGDPEHPEPEPLNAFLQEHSLTPTHAIGRLR